ncbi:MAG: FAD-binding oxidoreductase, partial [Pseudomonadota bacterium]
MPRLDLLTANDRLGAYPPSYYAATAELLDPLPRIEGEVRCDVAIVGGGYTGLSAALHMAERGYDVVLLEAQRVGFGASGRNGGQVAVGQRVAQDELERKVGREEARKLWDLSLESVALVHDLIARHGIECEWQSGLIEAVHTPALARDCPAFVDLMAER